MKSEKTFSCLHKILIALFIFEIVSGVLVAMICEYIKQLTQNRIFQFDKHEVLSVFFMVKLFGLHVSFYFMCGLPIVLLFNDVYTCHMRLLLKLWLLLAIETAVGSVFVIWCFTDATEFLVAHFEKSLKEGIKLYPHNPVWVLLWDDMQYEFKCCGIYNHTDWMRVNLATQKKQTIDHSLLPFSCAIGNIPIKLSLNDDHINKEGCFRVLSGIINNVKNIVVSLNVTIVVVLVSNRSFL